jgi:hypothetical protein
LVWGSISACFTKIAGAEIRPGTKRRCRRLVPCFQAFIPAIWFLSISAVLSILYRTGDDKGSPEFTPAQAPKNDQLQTLLKKIIGRILKLLTRLGHLIETALPIWRVAITMTRTT